MQFEKYFDFSTPDQIRLKGTSVGIEHVLYEYIYRGQTPDTITNRFYTVTLEQINASILYYLHNVETVSVYLSEWLASSQRAKDESLATLPPAVAKLMRVKAKQEELKVVAHPLVSV
jgi:uncharacterized protein (DUF433 family)